MVATRDNEGVMAVCHTDSYLLVKKTIISQKVRRNKK
jgi:hypothetical protein